MIEVQGPHETLSDPARRGRRDVLRQAGRDRRLPRPERRREDHDDAGPDRLPAADLRLGARRGPRRRDRSPRPRARRSGTCPESAATYPEMRVSEYLAFRARLEGVPGAQVRARVAEAIDRCLLGEVARRRIENLSKGFRQRTALAGALVHQPRVLILDEPTIGLDPVQIIKIRETIRELGRDRAVLLSTHILPEVEAVCDRVLIIDRGRIVAEGTPSELRAQARRQRPWFGSSFRGAVAAREALAALPGVTAVERRRTARRDDRARLTCAAGTRPARGRLPARRRERLGPARARRARRCRSRTSSCV